MNRSTSPFLKLLSATVLAVASITFPASLQSRADDALERQASWKRYDATQMATMLRSALDELGVSPGQMDRSADEFLVAVEQEDADPLDAFVRSSRTLVPVINDLVLLSG